jgi:hypothetical protein
MHQLLRQARNTRAITSVPSVIAGLKIDWIGLDGLMIFEVYAQSTQHPTRLGDEILSMSLVVSMVSIANRA